MDWSFVKTQFLMVYLMVAYRDFISGSGHFLLVPLTIRRVAPSGKCGGRNQWSI